MAQQLEDQINHFLSHVLLQTVSRHLEQEVFFSRSLKQFKHWIGVLETCHLSPVFYHYSKEKMKSGRNKFKQCEE